MLTHERRRISLSGSAALRAQLNESQLRMLRELEYFGWELRFVRHPPFQDAVPVIFAGDNAFVALRPDGSLDEEPAFNIRH